MNQSTLTTQDLINIAEEGLGTNLQWIDDKFDLEIRRKDKETAQRLFALYEAWRAIVRLQERAKMGTL